MKIKNPFTRNNEASNSGYSKKLEELQNALQDVVKLHAEEKPTGDQSKNVPLSASREKQALLLERVAALAVRAASSVRSDSKKDAVAPSGMQVYYNENPPPRTPVEEGLEFFKISFKNESRAEVIAET